MVIEKKHTHNIYVYVYETNDDVRGYNIIIAYAYRRIYIYTGIKARLRYVCFNDPQYRLLRISSSSPPRNRRRCKKRIGGGGGVQQRGSRKEVEEAVAATEAWYDYRRANFSYI